MPGLLGPTNPVPGYETPPVKVTTPPPNDTSVSNIVNPNQVVRPDGRTDQQDAGDPMASFAARYESNFMTFLQRLRDVPDLTASLLQVFQGQGTRVSSGIVSGFAAQLAQFLDFVKMDEGELLDFLKGQLQGGNRFTGALFQALRTAYAGTRSETLQTDILQFLRRYSDFSSTSHLEGKLLRTVSEMTHSLPARWADPLTQVLSKLENSIAAGDREGALRLVREQVFPLISQYVSLTHDHGRARGLLSLLTLDVARYDNGSPPALVQAFRRLTAGGALPRELENLSDEEVLRLLQDTDFARASRSDSFPARLAKMTGEAIQGKAGPEAEEAFRNILSSLLLNESVYMPLNHALLPLVWEDRLMFSEMWVDPDADKDAQQRQDAGGSGGTLRVLLKMDIEGLGAFDLLLNQRDGEVSMRVGCPPPVAAFSRQVSQALSGILERNGLKAASVDVGELRRPMTISSAFPKIFEKVSGVNVKI